MASRIFIAQTALNDLRPLAWQGVQAASCYDQLIRILLTKLSPQHAALLAEPLMDDSSRTVDWYAISESNTATTGALKISQLPPANQEALRAQMLALGREIYDLAQNLKKSEDSNSVTAGTLLEMALSFPSEDYLYAVDSQPVITCWGYVPGGADATPEMITRVRTGQEEVFTAAGAAFAANAENSLPHSSLTENTAVPNQNPANQNFGQNSEQIINEKIIYHEHRITSSPILWGILAFLLGATICGLLLFYFKPSWANWNIFNIAGCSLQPQALVNATNSTSPGNEESNGSNSLSKIREEILRGQGREDILRQDLERLRREYELRLLNCAPNEPVPFAQAPKTPEAPVPTPPEANVPPVPELNIPQPGPQPKPEPKPEPKPTPPAAQPAPPPAEPAPPAPKPQPKPDHLSIPDNPENLEFLEGCWEAEIASNTPGRYNTTPQRLVYCFDDKGKGKGALTERSNGREICVGPAQGELKGGSLAIKDKKPFSVGAGTCITEVITCTNADSGVAMCSSQLEDGGRSKLVFRRR